jgi:glycosylphosphatidylinositol transamidase
VEHAGLPFASRPLVIGQNHWAKEFVIVFGDGYADGLEAFLAAYHGIHKPGKSFSANSRPGAAGLQCNRMFSHPRSSAGWIYIGMEAQKLALAPQGVVWNALNIDYPGHSFSHLGIYYGA